MVYLVLGLIACGYLAGWCMNEFDTKGQKVIGILVILSTVGCAILGRILVKGEL